MIQLPDNWEQTARVKTLSIMGSDVLLLHFKNDSNQYFTYMQTFDLALPIEEGLKAIANRDWSVVQSYTLAPDLTTLYADPLDQNWIPAPIPAMDTMSLVQYKAIKASPNA